MHVRAGGISHATAEPEPPGSDPLREQLRQPGLEEGGRSSGECGDLLLIDVDADHVVSDRGHGGGVHGTEVPAADH